MTRSKQHIADLIESLLDSADNTPTQRARKHWSPSAVYCHTSGMNCGGCFNHRFYGLTAYVSCYMPLAVDELLARGVKIPKTLTDRVHLWQISDTIETQSATKAPKKNHDNPC